MDQEKKVGQIFKIWRSQILKTFQTFFLDLSPYPLCIRIPYESIYRSIIHHVSLSIILSRLRIHFWGPWAQVPWATGPPQCPTSKQAHPKAEADKVKPRMVPWICLEMLRMHDADQRRTMGQ